MGRSKGYEGESCADAIRQSFRSGETVAFRDLYDCVKRKGAWRDETIYQHLMACVVNLPPARMHCPGRDPFLFLKPDGRYELYDQKKHPRVIE